MALDDRGLMDIEQREDSKRSWRQVRGRKKETILLLTSFWMGLYHSVSKQIGVVLKKQDVLKKNKRKVVPAYCKEVKAVPHVM